MQTLPAQHKFRRRRWLNGFSLIEVLIAITVMGVLIIPLLISFRSSRTARALASSAEQVANQTRSVHIFAREARSQREWGIKNVDETTYVLYSSGTSGEMEEQRYLLEDQISFVENFNILFEIGTGNTEGNHTVNLVSSRGNKMYVDVSPTGLVEVRRQ